MLKIMILEDAPAERQRLEAFLQRYAEEDPAFRYTLTCYDRGITMLSEYHKDADILFLDIRVPDMLGIDVAKSIRKKDESVMIVFVTNLTQYAIEGYSVEAFDYILKPLKYPPFAAKLKRMLKALRSREQGYTVNLRDKENERWVSADSIVYIESLGHDLFFHVGGEVIRQWGTLSAYEEELRERGFARCHASFLVNLKYVETIRKNEVIVGGEAIPVSRPKRKSFLEQVAGYRGEKM